MMANLINLPVWRIPSPPLCVGQGYSFGGSVLGCHSDRIICSSIQISLVQIILLAPRLLWITLSVSTTPPHSRLRSLWPGVLLYPWVLHIHPQCWLPSRCQETNTLKSIVYMCVGLAVSLQPVEDPCCMYVWIGISPVRSACSLVMVQIARSNEHHTVAQE